MIKYAVSDVVDMTLAEGDPAFRRAWARRALPLVGLCEGSQPLRAAIIAFLDDRKGGRAWNYAPLRAARDDLAERWTLIDQVFCDDAARTIALADFCMSFGRGTWIYLSRAMGDKFSELCAEIEKAAA
jgi:hypothetical protein